ncbi:MAG TPA: SCO family protein [Gemmataceae bacterium]|nr:SCO family protein [Gemmataceae bacterium]
MLLSILPAEGSASRLAVIARAPEFSLTTQDGKNCRDSALKGKVVLVGFIFTTCNGTCPATTHRMASIQLELKRRGLDKDGRVQLLSISLDPARDNPDTLKRYMRLYDVDPSNWTFVTGDLADVNKVIAAWGMWARPAANGQLDHPSRVFLLDGLGRIREIYNLTFLKPAWVCEDMELLLREPSKVSKHP